MRHRLRSYVSISPQSSPGEHRSARSGALRVLLVCVLAGLGIVAAQGSDLRPFGAPAVVVAQTSTDWPQLQHDVKRSGYNPQSVSGPFNKKWSRDLGAALAHRVQPVIAGGVLVVGDVNGRVFGLNESNGTIRWTYQTAGPISFSAAIDGGRVFVGSQDGYLYALDVSTGGKVWQARTGGKPIGGAPLVYNSRVYVGGKDGFFYAFDAATGSLSWSFDTASAGSGVLRAPILSSPAIAPAKNRVYFAAENLRAYALNASTGQLAWSYQMLGESAYDS